MKYYKHRTLEFLADLQQRAGKAGMAHNSWRLEIIRFARVQVYLAELRRLGR
jgi:hypothetical protein